MDHYDTIIAGLIAVILFYAGLLLYLIYYAFSHPHLTLTQVALENLWQTITITVISVLINILSGLKKEK